MAGFKSLNWTQRYSLASVVIALENADLYTSLMNKVIELQESQKALIQAEKMAISGRLLALWHMRSTIRSNPSRIACIWLSGLN
jgi:hypothetical protein